MQKFNLPKPHKFTGGSVPQFKFIANPKRKWWTFWRPKMISVPIIYRINEGGVKVRLPKGIGWN